jgi:hypothetical protein
MRLGLPHAVQSSRQVRLCPVIDFAGISRLVQTLIAPATNHEPRNISDSGASDWGLVIGKASNCAYDLHLSTAMELRLRDNRDIQLNSIHDRVDMDADLHAR